MLTYEVHNRRFQIDGASQSAIPLLKEVCAEWSKDHPAPNLTKFDFGYRRPYRKDSGLPNAIILTFATNNQNLLDEFQAFIETIDPCLLT